MARTSTKTPAIESQALKADTKSEGMRILYEGGYTVAQVTKVFGVGYAFAYGVAKRGGFVQTAANRRPVKTEGKSVSAKAVTKAVKESRPVERKVASARRKANAVEPALTPGQKAYRARKARVAAEAARSEAQVAVAKRAGRPTAERRAANRTSKVAAVATKVARKRS
jgi:hypothetical protein